MGNGDYKVEPQTCLHRDVCNMYLEPDGDYPCQKWPGGCTMYLTEKDLIDTLNSIPLCTVRQAVTAIIKLKKGGSL